MTPIQQKLSSASEEELRKCTESPLYFYNNYCRREDQPELTQQHFDQECKDRKMLREGFVKIAEDKYVRPKRGANGMALELYAYLNDEAGQMPSRHNGFVRIHRDGSEERLVKDRFVTVYRDYGTNGYTLKFEVDPNELLQDDETGELSVMCYKHDRLNDNGKFGIVTSIDFESEKGGCVITVIAENPDTVWDIPMEGKKYIVN